MKNNKPIKPSINKDNFIDFLVNATPEEINNYIRDKGKPRKLIEPITFFDKEDKN